MKKNAIVLSSDTACGKLYATYDFDEKKFTFAMGKAGGCLSAQLETTGKLITLAVEKGASLREIKKILEGIKCHSPHFDDESRSMTTSCSDAIAKLLPRLQPGAFHDKK